MNPGRYLSSLCSALCLALSLTTALPAIAADGAAPVQRAVTININTADAETLADALQGVGPAKARAIIDYREANGPFTSPDQLKEVKGIGDALLKANAGRISVK